MKRAKFSLAASAYTYGGQTISFGQNSFFDKGDGPAAP